MEIILEETFKTVAGTSNASPSKKSSSKPSASLTKRRKRPGSSLGGPSITCHVVVPSRRTLFAGRDDGFLIVWRSPSERGIDMKETAYEAHTGGT